MPTITRRHFVTASAALPLLGSLNGARKNVGIMDGMLGASLDPSVMKRAATIGFDGVQIALGRPSASGALPLSDEKLQASYLAESADSKVALTSTYLDALHVNCLKNDPLAARWIHDGIEITKRLNVKILMLVFFGKCAIDANDEWRVVVKPLRGAAQRAGEAGITLGFENTLSAKVNARVLDAVDSSALQVFYDIGNSTNIAHQNAPEEIRWLGRERICQFHIKDKGYLGHDQVPVLDCARAIEAIHFAGWTVLETVSPSGDRLKDSRRNLQFWRAALAQSDQEKTRK